MKHNKFFSVILNTRVKDRNKISFIFFFVLTKCMSFSLRNYRYIGVFLKKVFSFLPQNAFIIQNSVGIWSVTPFNDTMTISADYFESEMKNWPREAVHKRIFIDVGSNIGRYTILAGNHFNYKRIISIEANPIACDILQKNIILNKLDQKVTIEHVAVGNREGEALLQGDSDNLGGSNVHTDPGYIPNSRADNQTKVPLTTVDLILNKYRIDSRAVDFIKIDVEGMECDVLEGMSNVLSHMSIGSLIMIEISNNTRSVLSILNGHKFKLIRSIAADNLFRKS